MAAIAVRVGVNTFVIEPDRRLVFGRADTDSVKGLDASDTGISTNAGAVQFEWNLWWVVNCSSTHPLFLETTLGSEPVPLHSGARHPVTVSPLVVLVRGANYTHRIEVTSPPEAIEAMRVPTVPSSSTTTFSEFALSVRDLEVLVGLFWGYLQPFPRTHPHPRSYQEAAEDLGPPWTGLRVRKQIERLKERFARTGLYFEGAHANNELARHLVDNGLLRVEHLTLIRTRQEK